MAFSLADMAMIHEAFEEYETVLQKISQAISTFHCEPVKCVIEKIS